MLNHKLIIVLKLCKQRQRNRYEKFVLSPFFNERQTVVQLVQYILHYAPDFKNDALKMEKLVKQFLQQDTAQNRNLVRQWAFAAFELWEQFWVHEHTQMESIYNQDFLIEFYSKHKLSDFLAQSFEKSLKQWEKKQTSYDYYYENYQLCLSRYKIAVSEGKGINRYFLEYQTAFKRYIILEQVKNYSSNLPTKKIADAEKDEHIDFVIKQIKEDTELYTSPLIRMHYEAIQLVLDASNSIHFSHLKQLLKIHYGDISPKDAAELYAACVNYCIRQANQSNDIVHTQQLFELYETQFRLKIIPHHVGYISPSQFKNIVRTALKLGHIPWARNFINETQSMLSENKEAVANFCMALCDFDEKQFKGIRQKLTNFPNVGVLFELEAQRLLIATCYEEKEMTLLNAHINSFRVSIHRKKESKTISLVQESQSLNFARFVFALSKPNKDWNALKEEIIATTHLSMRSWLLEKVDERLSSLAKI